ncbi:hypothetical protein EJ07DRAFT_151449 [Lizonia empirigonia]|nr:hypothetical protein EJ07DRAFT_151449 [Lizonia empirigonia]
MPPPHRGAGSMLANSYDGAAPFSDSIESAQTGIPLSSNGYGFQQPAFTPQVNHSALLQGLPEHEPSIAVGIGGYAYVQAAPSYAMNGFAATGLENTLSPYAYPHNWDGSVRSNSLDNCVDPRLTVNIVDFDAPQAGAQQREPVQFNDPQTNLGRGDLSHDGSSLDRCGTYDAPHHSQHPLLIDQMTANVTADQLPAPILTELEDVPFAQTRLMPNPPLFPFPDTKQSMLHGTRNENGLFSGQNTLSEGGMSLESPYQGWSSMSDTGCLASSAASWDPDFVPTDSHTAALPYMSRPRQQVRRRGLRASQGAMSDNSRDDLRRSLENLAIDNSSTQGGMMSSTGNTEKVTLLATSVSFTIEETTTVVIAARISGDKMRARSISKSSTWTLSPCFSLGHLSRNIQSSKCTNPAHFGYSGRYGGRLAVISEAKVKT